jgi:NAD(P)-dependent dehydrogenase (short-subunit alcohol dehydrogenase family)
MNTTMSGRRALVTGSTSGMGYAIAKRLAEAGTAVVLHGQNQARVDDAVARLTREIDGAAVTAVIADLNDPSAVTQLLKQLVAVDILISNAGPTETKPFFALTDEDWERFWRIYVASRSDWPVSSRRGWWRGVGGVCCSMRTLSVDSSRERWFIGAPARRRCSDSLAVSLRTSSQRASR